MMGDSIVFVANMGLISEWSEEKGQHTVGCVNKFGYNYVWYAWEVTVISILYVHMLWPESNKNV